jgi:GrpB-like predicted nucleotidyltransferase (UPF0157 family)
MKSHRPYELQEYDPTWKQRFLDAAESLRPIFGDNLVEIDHIGSTSIVGMVAKPQVDVLVVIKNLDAVKDQYDAFIKVGFTPKGRGYVAEDDEYMTEDSVDGKRLVSVHTLQEGNPKIAEYKIFRDYLQNNEEDRNLYSSTKRELYSKHHDNYTNYDSGKKEVITGIKARAKDWALRQATLVASAGASTRLAGSKLTDEEVGQINKSSEQK